VSAVTVLRYYTGVQKLELSKELCDEYVCMYIAMSLAFSVAMGTCEQDDGFW
jgi:hypothetical protein